MLLPGCAVYNKLLDTYFMAGYDTNEYGLINRITTLSQIKQEDCHNQELSRTNVDEIYIKTLEFKNFIQHTPGNKEYLKLADNILDVANQTKDAYAKEVSPVFCRLKLQQINRVAVTTQQVIGSKPR